MNQKYIIDKRIHNKLDHNIILNNHIHIQLLNHINQLLL